MKEQIVQLQALMQREGMDAYIIPTNDYHLSEYTGDFFKARRYMSGFTGSAGTLVVTKTGAGLWTDGRYFIQAENQLAGSGITLFRQAQAGVPTIDEYLAKEMPENGVLGFDGRTIPAGWGNTLETLLADKHVTIAYDKDLVDEIWTGRPKMPKDELFILEEKYSGKASADKLADLRAKMAEAGADIHVLTSLENIAWLYNLRGNDVANTPVFLSYTVITKDSAVLYVDADKINEKVADYLKVNHVEIRPYNDIYQDVCAFDKDQKVLLDKNLLNYTLFKNIKAEMLFAPNPTELAKAIKNDVEIENLFKAHIKDGVAVTKFMYWLKNNVGKIPMTEISASDYLAARRAEQEGFVDLSFTTICAYNANAAMMHYSATPDSNAELKPEGMLLVDSGGHYYEGTTDITRTFVLGPISDVMKKHFTAVLRGMLNLQNAKFLYGCRGINLDILARGPMWDMDIDYQCGTGHGVGYLLSVHEPPNGFRWKIVPERNDSVVFEAGMITTDEPGIYLEGQYGIRIENELVCRKGEVNMYGQFMHFEPLTFAPIDLDAVDVDELSATDKKHLNAYHQLVYDKISPYLTDDERKWLKIYTRAV